MEFNIQKYLIESKLTLQSHMREDDNTELTLNIDDEETEDDDRFDDNGDERDDWNKPEPDNSAEFEKEPSAKDVKKDDAALSGVHKKQAQLKALLDKKDMLLMQYKSGQMTLDQYKEAIGNVPQQIKKLKDQIDQAMNVSLDNDSEEELA